MVKAEETQGAESVGVVQDWAAELKARANGMIGARDSHHWGRPETNPVGAAAAPV